MPLWYTLPLDMLTVLALDLVTRLGLCIRGRARRAVGGLIALMALPSTTASVSAAFNDDAFQVVGAGAVTALALAAASLVAFTSITHPRLWCWPINVGTPIYDHGPKGAATTHRNDEGTTTS